MSTNIHVDTICIVVTVLTVALTLLFINGAALGIEPLPDGDSGSGQFTANDLDGEWDVDGATEIMLTSGGADIKGNGAYAADGNVYIVYGGKYVLTGALADGSVIIQADGGDKVWLLLDNVDIHCEDSAALLIEQAEKVFLTLADGTENTLSDGAAYGEDAVTAGIDGTLYARDDLTINGVGALTVTGEYQHGIVCNDDLVIAGGAVNVTAAQDGLHANDSVRIANADVSISAGDDGVTVSNDEQTGYFYMASGRLAVTDCYEGVEAQNVTVDGGTLNIACTDDGINASGGEAGSARITVNGGDIRIVNGRGMDADGLDSNGDILFNGGSVFISVAGSGGNCAVDYGSEYGGVCQVNGGTLVACGGSLMAESLDPASGQGFVETAASGGAGDSLCLTDGNGDALLGETIPNAFSYVMLSAPGMETGGEYTLSVDGAETRVTAGQIAGSPGMNGPGGMMMGGGPGGAFPGRDQARPAGQLPETDLDAAAGGGNGTSPALPEEENGEQMPIPEQLPDLSGDSGEQAPQPADDETAGGVPAGAERPVREAWVPQEESAPAAEVQSGVSPTALALLGVSVLTLLAGLLVAAKFRV